VTAIEAVLQRLAGEGGGLVIVDRCAPVERALKLMGLEQLTHVVPSLPEAVRYLEW
jgi:anti-anti-sigma regulatory factor